MHEAIEVSVWLPLRSLPSTAAERASSAFSPRRRLTTVSLTRRPSTSAERPLGSMSALSRCSSCSLHRGDASERPSGARAERDAGASIESRE